MFISTVDKVTTKKLKQRQKRKVKEAERTKKYRKMSDADRICVLTDTGEGCVYTSGADSDSDSSIRTQLYDSSCKNASTYDSSVQLLRRDMPALARACDRHGMSDRSAAAVASAVLEDCGLVTADDISNVIDKNKVRREREKTRRKLRAREQKHFCTLPWLRWTQG